jgi:hypothetical protein
MTVKLSDKMNEDKVDWAEIPRHSETVKRQIYPEVSDKFQGLAIWLGLGFVVVVVILQQFSGYL